MLCFIISDANSHLFDVVLGNELGYKRWTSAYSETIAADFPNLSSEYFYLVNSHEKTYILYHCPVSIVVVACLSRVVEYAMSREDILSELVAEAIGIEC